MCMMSMECSRNFYMRMYEFYSTDDKQKYACKCVCMNITRLISCGQRAFNVVKITCPSQSSAVRSMTSFSVRRGGEEVGVFLASRMSASAGAGVVPTTPSSWIRRATSCVTLSPRS